MRRNPKQIFIHDFAGHPFQVELARELARRGHAVKHLYFAGDLGPKGELVRQPQDPPEFSIEAITLGEPHAKYSYVKRWFQENRYALELSARIQNERPDIVISANTPLTPQRRAQFATHAYGGKFIFWLQDLLSVGIGKILPRKYPIVGNLVAKYYRSLEYDTLRCSDNIVCISTAFADHLRRQNISETIISVVENWAPKGEIQPMPKNNDWARRNNVVDKTVLLYAGTLGLKHNPELLRRLALEFRDHPEVAIVVASQGIGATWLADRKNTDRLQNLILLPFQPYSQLSAMLATGDILIAIIDDDAGHYSVPSKVLSYLASGRPLLVSVPATNLAARTVLRAGAGVVVEPNDTDGFIDAAKRMVADHAKRAEYAGNALAYAQANFDIGKIGDRFEQIIYNTTNH